MNHPNGFTHVCTYIFSVKLHKRIKERSQIRCTLETISPPITQKVHVLVFGLSLFLTIYFPPILGIIYLTDNWKQTVVTYAERTPESLLSTTERDPLI